MRRGRFSICSTHGVMTYSCVFTAGLFWLNQAQKPYLKDAQNTIGLLFFELLFLAFRTMFTALFTFPNEYKMVRPARDQCSTVRSISLNFCQECLYVRESPCDIYRPDR